MEVLAEQHSVIDFFHARSSPPAAVTGVKSNRMRDVTLVGTDIRTTALGFGTSALLGRLTKKESFRLLEVAYENGIRHFDTAPLYGFGESEALVGAFLRTHPGATVATKFGLLWPRSGSFLFQRAKDVGRPILRAFPALRRQARKAVNTEFKPLGNFDAAAAAGSLATSLKRLNRECVDLFLLHECRISDLQDERLLAFLSRAKECGHIRAFGVATDFATVKYCVESAPSYAPVVQLANNAGEPNLELMPELAQQRACITHSPFGGFGQGKTPLDAKAALRYAAEKNPTGIVLFSSQTPDHIVANVRSFA